MALEDTFRELNAHLYELHEALTALRTISAEDKPLEDDAVLVDVFRDAADDLLGWLVGAQEAAAVANRAAAHPADLDRAWWALLACQVRFQQVSRRLGDDLLSYERIAELFEFGEHRGGEWPAWTGSVHASLQECRPHTYAVADAIMVCWQEVGERLGLRATAVYATNIGQHLVLPAVTR